MAKHMIARAGCRVFDVDVTSGVASMLEALKVFWRILTESGEDRTWFPHRDGKRMCRWNLQRHEYEFKPISRKELYN
jgi:hypothetical protein